MIEASRATGAGGFPGPPGPYPYAVADPRFQDHVEDLVERPPMADAYYREA